MSAPQEVPVYPIFELELIRSLRDGVHKQNQLLTQQNDVLARLADVLFDLNTSLVELLARDGKKS